jgi:hypothetical protein
MPIRRKNEDAQMKAVYAEVRKNFTAADLQKYAEVTPTVPFLEIIEEVEAEQRKMEKQSKPRKSGNH